MGLFGPPNIEKMKAKDDVEGLIMAMSYKKCSNTCRSAAMALTKIGSPAVNSLIKALGDEDNEMRKAAAGVLGKIGDDRAVEPLIKALGDKDSDVRETAVRALGKIGDARAVEPLIKILLDWSKDVRLIAGQTLVKIGGAHAMIRALKDKNRNVRLAAFRTLESMDWKPDRLDYGVHYYESLIANELWEKCIESGFPAVEPLIKALEDEDSEMRKAAAGALGKIGDARAVEPLIKALEDEDSEMRKAAAGALGKIGDARAVEPLIKVIGNKEWRVRKSVAEALGQIGDARAVEPLIRALGDEDYRVREAAVGALSEIGSPSVEPLIRALEDKRDHVRGSAAEALGQIGDARAVEPLIRALGDKESDVRESAAGALDALGWKPRDDEAGAYYWIRKNEFRKCIEIGFPAVDALIRALGHKDGDVRESAAGALGKIGDVRAVEPLIKALGDSYMRKAAAEALGKIGDARAVEPLIEVLGDTITDVRKSAARALVKMYKSDRLNELQKSLLLTIRSKITSRHLDIEKASCDGGHSDIGIGVNFPL